MDPESIVKITADTNVLVRAATPAADPQSEDGKQAAQARAVLRNATLIAVTIPTLCEFVWVLRKAYGYSRNEIVTAVRTLCAGATVVCDHRAVDAGLHALTSGGDFADGAIAHLGRTSGGETFVSFDRKAVQLLGRLGYVSRLAGETHPHGG
jgi:predicted nucleic-acid-binding protein